MWRQRGFDLKIGFRARPDFLKSVVCCARNQTYLDKSKDSDIDKADWNRAIFYLADYPNHKQDFQNLLEKMVKDRDHSYHHRAVSLQKELGGKGVLPK